MGPVTGEQQWDMVRVVGDTIEELQPDAEGNIVRSYSPAHDPGPPRPYTLLLAPKGKSGPFEKVTFGPGTVKWNPTGRDPIVFAFQQDAGPNAPGISLISKKEIQF